MNYYDYDGNNTITCSHCGWMGRAKDGLVEYFDQLFTVDCPTCSNGGSLLIVDYPTIQEVKAAALKRNDDAVSELPYALLVEKARALNGRAEKLVKERIRGMRKGTTEIPNWTHSLRVRDMLAAQEFNHEVVLAGTLHDVIEDGEVTLDELRGMGFSERVVMLVDLCSHDNSVVGSEARWVKMMARLVDANDRDAWAIKVADIVDNLRSCHTMHEERQLFMRHVKGELLLRLSQPLLGEHVLWRELRDEVGNKGKIIKDQIRFGLYGDADRPLKFGFLNDQPFCDEIVNGKLVQSKLGTAEAMQDATLITEQEFNALLK